MWKYIAVENYLPVCSSSSVAKLHLLSQLHLEQSIYILKMHSILKSQQQKRHIACIADTETPMITKMSYSKIKQSSFLFKTVPELKL